MKKIKLILCLSLLVSTFSHISAQDAAPQEESIYVRALNQYIRWVNKFEPETDTLYFEELKGITTLFPKELDGLSIKILTGRNQAEIYQQHDNTLTQRKMTPAKVIKNKIEIGIIPYEGRLEPNRGIILSLRKWHAVIFEYNPETQSFEYARFENR
ncbi:MAG: hypothetical protein HEP71_24260 [Roseivirga sp.]|nr:hypothetical protein [Roseivirga sp.]